MKLKEELAALKRQQKLQKQRLLIQKEQKKQRKLLKQQQQQQKFAQEAEAKVIAAAATAAAAVLKESTTNNQNIIVKTNNTSSKSTNSNTTLTTTTTTITDPIQPAITSNNTNTSTMLSPTSTTTTTTTVTSSSSSTVDFTNSIINNNNDSTTTLRRVSITSSPTILITSSNQEVGQISNNNNNSETLNSDVIINKNVVINDTTKKLTTNNDDDDNNNNNKKEHLIKKDESIVNTTTTKNVIANNTEQTINNNQENLITLKNEGDMTTTAAYTATTTSQPVTIANTTATTDTNNNNNNNNNTSVFGISTIRKDIRLLITNPVQDVQQTEINSTTSTTTQCTAIPETSYMSMQSIKEQKDLTNNNNINNNNIVISSSNTSVTDQKGSTATTVPSTIRNNTLNQITSTSTEPQKPVIQTNVNEVQQYTDSYAVKPIIQNQQESQSIGIINMTQVQPPNSSYGMYDSFRPNIYSAGFGQQQEYYQWPSAAGSGWYQTQQQQQNQQHPLWLGHVGYNNYNNQSGWYGNFNEQLPYHQPHWSHYHGYGQIPIQANSLGLQWQQSLPVGSSFENRYQTTTAVWPTSSVQFHQQATASTTQAVKKTKPTRTVKKQHQPNILASNPCEAPSPFANTHEIIAQTIRVRKKPGDTFGIKLKLDMQSVLVDNPLGKRRKRVFFKVQNVLDASKQNSRHQENILETDDIILTVNNKPTGELTFAQACMLFQVDGPVTDEGWIECPITIARRRKPVIKPIINLPQIQQKPRQIGPLTPSEILKLCQKILIKEDSLLGAPMNLQPDHVLPWNNIRLQVNKMMRQKATEYWKDKDMTDSQRHRMMISLHHNNTVCRCGSREHIYVNHPDCPIYKNFRQFLTDEDDIDDTGMSEKDRNKKLKKHLPSDLNVVEKAFKDRFVRMKTEQEAQEAEARFIAKMEEIQMDKFHQAIVAPSLTVMILSAVSELQEIFETMELNPYTIGTKIEVNDEKKVDEENKNNESDDDEDDVPLTALGKRSMENDDASVMRKKQRSIKNCIRPQFLARMAKIISDRWGHAYKEPSNADYVWRWEVYHGQRDENGSNKWDLQVNPKKEHTLSLENIRFLIDEKVFSDIEKDDSDTAKIEAMKMVTSVVSPECTGLNDELLALIKTNILSLDKRGIPYFTKDWWSHVDILILDEMAALWGLRADPKRRCLVSDKIRKTLGKRWIRTERGWAYASDEDDVVFEFDEFDEWRSAYEEKQQSRSDGTHGIGQFS